jgi:hypothetical protein
MFALLIFALLLRALLLAAVTSSLPTCSCRNKVNGFPLLLLFKAFISIDLP